MNTINSNSIKTSFNQNNYPSFKARLEWEKGAKEQFKENMRLSPILKDGCYLGEKFNCDKFIEAIENRIKEVTKNINAVIKIEIFEKRPNRQNLLQILFQNDKNYVEQCGLLNGEPEIHRIKEGAIIGDELLPKEKGQSPLVSPIIQAIKRHITTIIPYEKYPFKALPHEEHSALQFFDTLE